ncbi:MAG TPA: hypothetical protein P5092_08760 [Ruminococcus sp.]|nr:hypothetical protein [Ruminococcus sp.]
MKNPMNENNINTELFEAIDENAVNGGLSAMGINTVTIQPISSAMPPVLASVRYACLTVVTKDFRCLNASLRIQCSIRLAVK